MIWFGRLKMRGEFSLDGDGDRIISVFPSRGGGIVRGGGMYNSRKRCTQRTDNII